MKRVLITGASGFVGSALVPELISRGWWVRASVRGQKQAGKTLSDTEYVRAGPLGPCSDWSKALDGVDRVVHLAGWSGGTNLQQPETEANGVNVDGSTALATQCVAMGVKRLVYLSSAKVFGESSGPRPFCETDNPCPQAAYARSKLEAERALWRVAANSSLEVVVIRAPLIYGPGVSGNFLRLLRLSHSGVPLPFASIRNRRSLLFVGNLCDLVELTLRSAAAVGKVLLASDGQDLSTGSLIRILRRQLGQPDRVVPCPVAALRLCALLAGKRPLVDRLVESLQLDISATREVLGWRPPTPVEDALAETAIWYRDRVSREVADFQQAFDRNVP
jgi:nucleoside-diphosphate-sugar epimerase